MDRPALHGPAPAVGLVDHLSTGVAASVVGFSSSFSVVLAALAAVGATQAEARSGLTALCVVMGALTVALSWRARTPIGVAWSTPGAASLLTVAVGSHRFGEAVGGFAVTAVLLLATAVVPALRRAAGAVPPALAAGLLAGVLLPLCLAPVTAARARPADVLPVVAAWLLVLRWDRRLAVPAAVLVAAAVTAIDPARTSHAATPLLPTLHLVAPSVTAWSVVAVALPLYLTTMAGQNLPALSLLDGFGYRIPLGTTLAATAIGTGVVAPLGGHAVNLAALTTAMTASPDADPDPARRWRVTAISGGVYVALGVLSGAVATGAALAPSGLLRAVASIALLGALADAIGRVSGGTASGGTASAGTASGGTAPGLTREAALVTLLVTASGVTVAGVGSPVVGLAAGLVVHSCGRAARLSHRR